MLLCELVKVVVENEENTKTYEIKKYNDEYANVKSFTSALLGALIVNIIFMYLKF